jgi:septal ring factor EnvC (AmiA/AmiB activator)
MKTALQNLKSARLALLSLLLACALSGVLLRSAWQARQAAQQQLTQLQMALNEAQRKLALSGTEKDLVQRYLDAYHRLQQRGFIADDQRLAWRDTLDQARRSLNIAEMKFSIGPQQPYAGARKLDTGDQLLREARVNFSAQLLQENQFAQLIARLAAQPHGIFGVRDCTLQRTSLQMPADAAPQLQTQCTFAWYTLAPPNSDPAVTAP